MLSRFAVSWLCACLGVGCSAPAVAPNAGFVDAPISVLASQVSGQVVEVSVREGDRVKRGQVVVRLDARERQAFAQEAEANVQHAREAVREAEQNAEALTPTLRSAEAEIERQHAELDDARLEFDRAQHLFSLGALAAAQRDTARARLDQARASMEGTGAAKQTTRGKLGTARAGIRTARALLLGAEASLALARIQLEEAEIRSPFDGLVAEVNLRPGEWALPGTPVVTLEDLARQWVRFDIEETRLGSVRIGQPVSIRVIAFPGRRYAGHVIEVGAEAEFALNRDVKRGRPDVRTFRVRAAFDTMAPELRPGMTAEAAFVSAPTRP